MRSLSESSCSRSSRSCAAFFHLLRDAVVPFFVRCVLYLIPQMARERMHPHNNRKLWRRKKLLFRLFVHYSERRVLWCRKKSKKSERWWRKCDGLVETYKKKLNSNKFWTQHFSRAHIGYCERTKHFQMSANRKITKEIKVKRSEQRTKKLHFNDGILIRWG